MNFIFSWFNGNGSMKSENPVWTFDLEGSKLFVDGIRENLNEDAIWTFEINDDELTIYENAKEEKYFIINGKDKKSFKKLSKSICCLQEAKQPSPIQKAEKLPSPLPPSDNPYDSPFWSKEIKGINSWLKTYYFFNAEILGGRGCMALNRELTLPTGSQVLGSCQMVTDGHRWGNAEFTINHEAQTLPQVGCPSGKVSEELLQLLEVIYQLFQKNKSVFQRFSSYFHQGPYNDMFYTIQGAIEAHFGKILHQDQQKMRRSVHLYKKDKSNILILAMDGIFRYAIEEDGSSIKEAAKNSDFGKFHGIALINLETQAAVVRLGTELSD